MQLACSLMARLPCPSDPVPRAQATACQLDLEASVSYSRIHIYSRHCPLKPLMTPCGQDGGALMGCTQGRRKRRVFTKRRWVQSMREEGKLQGCGTGVQTSPEAQGRGQAVTGDQVEEGRAMAFHVEINHCRLGVLQSHPPTNCPQPEQNQGTKPEAAAAAHSQPHRHGAGGDRSPT